MSDVPQTPEAVASILLQMVAKIEGKWLNKATGGQRPDRKWVLDTYDECLSATKGKRLPRS